MTDTYATADQLEARLSSAYTVPTDAAKLLLKASELIDYHTRGRAQAAFDGTDETLQSKLADATCDQVEFWLEVGEEHDVEGLTGALQGGRVQIQHLPNDLGRRARRTLAAAGLYWAGASAL